MAELQNTINEYEKIDSDLSDNTKVGILNRGSPRKFTIYQYLSI